MKSAKYIILLITLAFTAKSQPYKEKKLSISAIFADHMVIQRNSKIALWGYASPNKKIYISTNWGHNASTTVKSDGKWIAKLLTPNAGGPFEIDVRCGKEKINIKDVMSGEVWLASGQSNMDIPLKGWPPGDTILNSKIEIEKSFLPNIRYFKVPFRISVTPIDTLEGNWNMLTPGTAGDFSATAFFFAKKIYQELKIPVGIIQSSIGGTPAEAWTSRSVLLPFPEFRDHTDEKATNRKINSNTPAVLFNAMINPLVKYKIKGVIWYQGESNVGRADQYKQLFPAMIIDWRKQWGEVLPFYYVQLAPYMYNAPNQKNQSQKLRDAQRYGLQLPKTGMVSTLDIGYMSTAHPPYKQKVGARLAGFALANLYSKNIQASGPIFRKAYSKGKNLIVKFTNAKNGLEDDGHKLNNFEIAGNDTVYYSALVKINGNKLILSSNKVIKPHFVRYAWSDSSSATLFNKAKLPAATFTSER